jgi:hypothetical protein
MTTMKLTDAQHVAGKAGGSTMKYTGLTGTILSLDIDLQLKISLVIEDVCRSAIETWPEMTESDIKVITAMIEKTARETVANHTPKIRSYLLHAKQERQL